MSDTVSLRFPYGREELTLDLPASRLQAVLTPAHNLEEALALADGMLGRPDASVTAIPDGVAVMVV